MREYWIIEEKDTDGRYYPVDKQVHMNPTSCKDELKELRKEYSPTEYRMRKYVAEKPIKKLLGELYQVLGVLDAGEDVMDQVSAAIAGKKLPHKTLLPFQIDDGVVDTNASKFNLRPGNEFLIKTLSKTLPITIEPPEDDDYTYTGKASPLVKPKILINDCDGESLRYNCLKVVRELENLKVEHNRLLKELRNERS